MRTAGAGARGALALSLALLTTASAAALGPPRGAVDARLWLALDGRLGGAVSSEIGRGWGALHLGGLLSVGALSAGDGESSRVFAPVGLSLGVLPAPEAGGLTLALRGGPWLGAIKGDVIGHAWAGGALGYRVALGEGAAVRVGLDVWSLFGQHDLLLFSLYAGLGF